LVTVCCYGWTLVTLRYAPSTCVRFRTFTRCFTFVCVTVGCYVHQRLLYVTVAFARCCYGYTVYVYGCVTRCLRSVWYAPHHVYTPRLRVDTRRLFIHGCPFVRFVTLQFTHRYVAHGYVLVVRYGLLHVCCFVTFIGSHRYPTVVTRYYARLRCRLTFAFGCSRLTCWLICCGCHVYVYARFLLRLVLVYDVDVYVAHVLVGYGWLHSAYRFVVTFYRLPTRVTYHYRVHAPALMLRFVLFLRTPALRGYDSGYVVRSRFTFVVTAFTPLGYVARLRLRYRWFTLRWLLIWLLPRGLLFCTFDYVRSFTTVVRSRFAVAFTVGYTFTLRLHVTFAFVTFGLRCRCLPRRLLFARSFRLRCTVGLVCRLRGCRPTVTRFFSQLFRCCRCCRCLVATVVFTRLRLRCARLFYRCLRYTFVRLCVGFVGSTVITAVTLILVPRLRWFRGYRFRFVWFTLHRYPITVIRIGCRDHTTPRVTRLRFNTLLFPFVAVMRSLVIRWFWLHTFSHTFLRFVYTRSLHSCYVLVVVAYVGSFYRTRGYRCVTFRFTFTRLVDFCAHTVFVVARGLLRTYAVVTVTPLRTFYVAGLPRTRPRLLRTRLPLYYTRLRFCLLPLVRLRSVPFTHTVYVVDLRSGLRFVTLHVVRRCVAFAFTHCILRCTLPVGCVGYVCAFRLTLRFYGLFCGTCPCYTRYYVRCYVYVTVVFVTVTLPVTRWLRFAFTFVCVVVYRG